MIRGIDHLVIACDDPDAAAAELETTLRIACTGGGRHERFGTRNRIAWLADGSYVELIGIEDASLVEANPVGIAARGVLESQRAGLATFALAADDLEALVSSLRAAGAPIGAVQHGSRRRDDGEVVAWRAAFPDHPLGPAAVPFLIEHEDVGAEWGRAAREERARSAHPIGSPVSLVRLAIAADDPVATAMEIGGTLGAASRAVADLAVVDIGAHELRLVPRRELPVPAVVTLAADVAAPRTAELLGLRFNVEPAESTVGRASAPTSGRG